MTSSSVRGLTSGRQALWSVLALCRGAVSQLWGKDRAWVFPQKSGCWCGHCFYIVSFFIYFFNTTALMLLDSSL